MSVGETHTESNSSLRIVDVIIGLLQRDRIDEALECQLIAITFAANNEITTEEAMRMPLDEIVEQLPPPPSIIPYVPQVQGWDHVFYGETAERDDEK